jgi:hypothetical protein
MGNIFTYCWKIRDNMHDNHLLEPLNNRSNVDSVEYASFLENNSSVLDHNSIVLEHINMLNTKVEILENTTQKSLKSISSDIRHIYSEQEELKKITSPNNSIMASIDYSIYHETIQGNEPEEETY